MKVFLIALILGLNTAVIQAANVTVEASGAMTLFSDPGGLLPFTEPGSGTVFSLRLTYDDATPDDVLFPGGGSIDAVPSVGSYNDAILSMTLGFGAESFELRPINFINVIDDEVSSQTGEISDLWVAKTLTETPTGNTGELLLEGFGIIFVEEGTPPIPSLTSDNLVTPEWPGSWDRAMIFYNLQLETEVNGETTIETLANVNAELTSFSVVPTPAAVWLFGSALGLLGWMRQKAN
jgi:hypothetical protein